MLLGYAVDQIWFREDDLGTILNGIIRSWDDFVRVFSADCRSFITPANYQRTFPNVISGFLRPMQNVVFSVVYYFWGVDAWAYYLMHVACHALNSVLFFMLCNTAIRPLKFQYTWIAQLFALSAGFLFAFYPDVSWLPWIGTVQNSLATFFLLLMGLFLFKRHTLLAAIMFLCSLLSRESGLLLPFWLFLGAFLFKQEMTNPDADTSLASPFLQRFWFACRLTWMFFMANVFYTLMRLWSFGCATLPRTLRNACLRYPWLANYFCASEPAQTSAVVVQNLVQAQPVIPAQALPVVQKVTLLQALTERVSAIFHSWFQSIFNVCIRTDKDYIFALIFAFCLAVFLVVAYRKNIKLLFWLCCGFICVAWPGVLAYPNPRYINLVYPFIIFIIMYGVALLCSSIKSKVGQCSALSLFCVVAGIASMHGLSKNQHNLAVSASDRYLYKKRFDDFFSKHTFDRHARFVLLSSPFVSDIQSIFQAYLGNLDTVVVFDPFATLAEHKSMGCRKPYRVTDVESEIIPISGGFRLLSHDKDACGWWLRFSDFPIAWCPQYRSYEWMKDPYQEGKWYECSVGKFKINGMVDADCVHDISFVFDKQWIDEKTIFVAWDSKKGEYVLVDGSHLLPERIQD